MFLNLLFYLFFIFSDVFIWATGPRALFSTEPVSILQPTEPSPSTAANTTTVPVFSTATSSPVLQPTTDFFVPASFQPACAAQFHPTAAVSISFTLHTATAAGSPHQFTKPVTIFPTSYSVPSFTTTRIILFVIRLTAGEYLFSATLPSTTGKKTSKVKFHAQ